jgi:hypothetical protein
VQQEKIVLGAGIGGVIVDRAKVAISGGDDFLFLDAAEVPGAIDALRRLVVATRESGLGCDVHLVSECRPSVQAKTIRWLAHRRFEERTGIPLENVSFCNHRRDKAAVCADLGITHFVDDRLEILGHLSSVRTKFLFRPDRNEVNRFARHLPSVRVAESWDDIASYVLR